MSDGGGRRWKLPPGVASSLQTHETSLEQWMERCGGRSMSGTLLLRRNEEAQTRRLYVELRDGILRGYLSEAERDGPPQLTVVMGEVTAVVTASLGMDGAMPLPTIPAVGTPGGSEDAESTDGNVPPRVDVDVEERFDGAESEKGVPASPLTASGGSSAAARSGPAAFSRAGFGGPIGVYRRHSAGTVPMEGVGFDLTTSDGQFLQFRSMATGADARHEASDWTLQIHNAIVWAGLQWVRRAREIMHIDGGAARGGGASGGGGIGIGGTAADGRPRRGSADDEDLARRRSLRQSPLVPHGDDDGGDVSGRGTLSRAPTLSRGVADREHERETERRGGRSPVSPTRTPGGFGAGGGSADGTVSGPIPVGTGAVGGGGGGGGPGIPIRGRSDGRWSTSGSGGGGRGAVFGGLGGRRGLGSSSLPAGSLPHFPVGGGGGGWGLPAPAEADVEDEEAARAGEEEEEDVDPGALARVGGRGGVRGVRGRAASDSLSPTPSEEDAGEELDGSFLAPGLLHPGAGGDEDVDEDEDEAERKRGAGTVGGRGRGGGGGGGGKGFGQQLQVPSRVGGRGGRSRVPPSSGTLDAGMGGETGVVARTPPKGHSPTSPFQRPAVAPTNPSPPRAAPSMHRSVTDGGVIKPKGGGYVPPHKRAGASAATSRPPVGGLAGRRAVSTPLPAPNGSEKLAAAGEGEACEGPRLRAGVWSAQGRRPNQEDAHILVADLLALLDDGVGGAADADSSGGGVEVIGGRRRATAAAAAEMAGKPARRARYSFLAVLDGHAGDAVSRFGAEDLPVRLARLLAALDEPGGSGEGWGGAGAGAGAGAAAGADRSSLSPSPIDPLAGSPPRSGPRLADGRGSRVPGAAVGAALESAVLETDRAWSLEAERRGGRALWAGATLVATLIDWQTGLAWTAALGDSQAVLCRDVDAATLAAEALSVAHTPADATEHARIERVGGWVRDDSEIRHPVLDDLGHDFLRDPLVRACLERILANGEGGDAAELSDLKRGSVSGTMVSCARVCGEIGVSRALGDVDYKEPRVHSYPFAFPKGHSRTFSGSIVSGEPDVRHATLPAARGFFILACDGLWDVLTPVDAVQFAARALAAGRSPTEAAKELVTIALKFGSNDNITCLIALVDDAPDA